MDGHELLLALPGLEQPTLLELIRASGEQGPEPSAPALYHFCPKAPPTQVYERTLGAAHRGVHEPE